MRKLGYLNTGQELYAAATKATEVLDGAVKARHYVAFSIIASDSILEDPVIAYRLGGDAYKIKPEIIVQTLKAIPRCTLSGAYEAKVDIGTYVRDDNYTIISEIRSERQAWFGVMPIYDDTDVDIINASELGKRIQEEFNRCIEIDAKLEQGSGNFIVADWRTLRYNYLQDDILEAEYAIVSNADKIMAKLLKHVRFGTIEQRYEMALVTFPHQGDSFFEPTARYKLSNEIAEGDISKQERELYAIAERALKASRKVDLYKATEGDLEDLKARVLHIARGGACERFFDIVLVCRTDRSSYIFNENDTCDDIDDTIDTILAEGCTDSIKPVVWDEIGDYLCRF